MIGIPESSGNMTAAVLHVAGVWPAGALSTRGPRPQVLLMPPVCGLYPPLDTSFPAIAEHLGQEGFRASVLRFAGQNGASGAYSVASSCAAAARFASRIEGPVLFFGICSGGIAALAASIHAVGPAAVFCWDVALRYNYTPRLVEQMAKRYNVRFCRDTCLLPVQPSDLVPRTPATTTFAFPSRSTATTAAAQRALAALTPRGRVREIPGLTHLPGVPRGSERAFGEILVGWAIRSCDELRCTADADRLA